MAKRMLIYLLEWLIKILWIIPLDRTRITFVSFNGMQYSDSPKYIYEKLVNTYNYKYSWILEDFNFNIPGKAEKVKKGSLTELIRLVSSKCIITNNYLHTYIPIRKGQVVLNTWHGCGVIKKVGLMANSATNYDNWFFKKHARKYSAFTSDSCTSEELLLKKSFGFKGEVLRFGLPKNAILLNENSALRKRIRQQLGFSDDIIVLYAPTFRGNAVQGNFIERDQYLDSKKIQDIISEKYNKPCRIIFRGHHAFKREIANEIDDFSHYPDMQELLLACDILISDYSSCMWDMSLQYKPVYVYAPDICEYRKEQGFYTDPKDWPFSISKTNEELLEAIRTYNQDEYRKKLDTFFEEVNSYEVKESLSKTCEWIVGKMNDCSSKNDVV